MTPRHSARGLTYSHLKEGRFLKIQLKTTLIDLCKLARLANHPHHL